MIENTKNISIEIEKLREEIRNHDYLYYINNQSEISDFEYDKLLKKLIELEKKHPELVTPDSPSQRVSGQVAPTFKPVKHSVSMLSLDNTYSSEEIAEWFQRVEKNLKNEKLEFIVEPKIDGVGLSLVYKNGVLDIGATRGDGETGEDITPNVKTIRSIPLKFISKKNPEYFDVRGEVYIDKKDFSQLNKKISDKGEQAFANPRNAAAGSLRQKDSKVTASRPLDFFVHSFGKIDNNLEFKSQKEFLDFCKKNGLKTNPYTKLFHSIDKVIDYCNEMEGKRDNLDYEIDGMVIKINSLSQQKILGYTMKSPRWAIAFKFAAKQATTKIDNIRVQVGRTGIITPVADLEPVELSGVTISHATLHNFDEIKRLSVRIGDTVVIERAGDVIPKVIKVIESKRTGHEKVFHVPKNCPVCSGPITKDKEDEVAYKCINPSCPEQLVRGIMHFAKREAMDIEGMGEAAVQQLVNKGKIKSFADIYKLEKKDLMDLDLYKDKKAENLIAAINKSKKQPLSRLLNALGIKNVGEKAAQTLAEQFHSIDKLMDASKEELTQINEIGPVMAESIVEYFNQASVKKLIQQIKHEHVNTTEPERQVGPQPLAGKTFVLTGELKIYSRNEAEHKIKELGGKASSSVSKKTDYVVVGENPGSKFDKAKKLGVNIISEEEFKKLIS